MQIQRLKYERSLKLFREYLWNEIPSRITIDSYAIFLGSALFIDKYCRNNYADRPKWQHTHLIMTSKPEPTSSNLLCSYRVYCKYHYLEGHESENAEIEIFKFLVKISKNELDITKKQYGEETQDVPFTVESKYCIIMKE